MGTKQAAEEGGKVEGVGGVNEEPLSALDPWSTLSRSDIDETLQIY